jgi:hypothetical protein
LGWFHHELIRAVAEYHRGGFSTEKSSSFALTRINVAEKRLR